MADWILGVAIIVAGAVGLIAIVVRAVYGYFLLSSFGRHVIRRNYYKWRVDRVKRRIERKLERQHLDEDIERYQRELARLAYKDPNAFLGKE